MFNMEKENNVENVKEEKDMFKDDGALTSGQSCEKKKKRKVKKGFIFVCVSKFFLMCLLILILVLFPLAKVLYDKHGNEFSEKFFGKKSQYQGILRLWNIDSFEGGSLPKSNFLENVAMLFEKKNKGVLIMVQNMSEDEVVSSVKSGIYPDMVCFGTGMNKFFNGKFHRLDDSIGLSLLPNFYSAGLQNGAFVAVPIMAGAYSLISSNERIDKAGKDPQTALSTLAFALAVDTVKKKGTIHTNSLTFGKGEFTSALDAFSRKFVSSSVVSLAESGIVDSKYNSQSPYEAYECFVLGKSNILLGTQRDVFRMENRAMAGKESGVRYEPIKEFTDLVQYLGILANSKVKYQVCEKFIAFILEEKQQKLLEKIGMFSVTGAKVYDKLPLSGLEKVIDDKIIVKSTF